MDKSFALVALFALTGCTGYDPPPVSADNPASRQARESAQRPHSGLVADATTRAVNARLSQSAATAKSAETMGDMGNMQGMQRDKMGGMKMNQTSPSSSPAEQRGEMKGIEGMDHSKMQGMDMNKQPVGVPVSQPEGMNHSKMQGMTTPAPGEAASPASKEGVADEMKKTSDEMKKLSDDMKAKSDAAKSTEKPSPTPSQPPPPKTAYWTCVMHPEIRQDAPGNCRSAE